MSQQPAQKPLDLGDREQLHQALVDAAVATSQRARATRVRLGQLRDAKDPAVIAEERWNFTLGMLQGVLENQVLILGTLAHLLGEASSKTRVEISSLDARNVLRSIQGRS